MTRSRIILCLLLLVVLAGCTGDTGPQGPVGPPGTGAISVLLYSTDTEDQMKRMIVVAFERKVFPTGTIIDFKRMQDPLPSLSQLSKYDAILAWTTNTLPNRVAIGDVLAEYVDAGGGLVLGQGAFTEGVSNLGPLAGRIMTDGYSPLRPAPRSAVPENRKIVFDSLSFPLHPVFNGTDVLNLCSLSQPQFSAPGLDPTATLIATDTECIGASVTVFNSIAVSRNGRVMSFNMYPGWDVYEVTFPQTINLFANALLFVSGAIS